jgi:hypothetical protein
VDGRGAYSCTCAEGFIGANCEHHVCKDQKSPCLNGGTCYGDGQCACVDGYIGATCDLHRCSIFQCLNGGTCLPNGTCLCLEGFLGASCGVDICTLPGVSCYNGGTCLRGKCRCTLEYTGTDCTIKIQGCGDAPCLNGGTCVDLDDSYECQCHPDYVGPKCEQHINETSFTLAPMPEPSSTPLWPIAFVAVVLIAAAALAVFLCR